MYKNKKFNIISLFAVLLTIQVSLNINYSYGYGSDTLNVSLDWIGVRSYQISDSESTDFLSFKDAETLAGFPGIEVYQNTLPISIPHFSPSLQLIERKTVNVSQKESKFLSQLGFYDEEFSLISRLNSSRKEYSMEFFVVPVRYNSDSGNFEKLLEFDIAYEYVFDAELKYGAEHDYSDNSVLASGNWYKLCIEETGIYKLTYSHLEELGINPSQVQKSSIAIYGNGGGMLPEANSEMRPDDLIENAIFVSGGGGTFGQNDYILFYGESPNQWKYNEESGLFEHEVHLYSDRNCYFLTTTTTNGKRITSRPSSNEPATQQVSKFQDYAYHQRDLINLIESGRVWFGEVFDITLTRNFEFQFPNLDHSSKAYVTTHLAARSAVNSNFTVKAGGSQKNLSIPAINPAASGSTYFARDALGTLEFTPSSGNTIDVELSYNRTAQGGRGWLNYIALNVTRNLRFNAPQMNFRTTLITGPNNVFEYTITNANSQINIWDVTDVYNIVGQDYQLSGTQAIFKTSADELREFIAFNGSSFLTPNLIGSIGNQNLHALSGFDMIIVSPAQFLPEAQRLADFRLANDGIASVIVTPEQVYNEFSSGVQDISAIRNFMKMFYDRALNDDFPKYLLLFGNGTYDNKNILGYGGNFIPTFQTEISLHAGDSWMTDDYFGLLDEHEGQGAEGLLDIGIGRLPVRTIEQAEIIVDKIIRYDNRIEGWAPGSDDLHWVGQISNYADWRNMVTLIADDQDNNLHFNDSESLAAIIEDDYPVYNIEKIYLDAYEQVTMAGGSRYPEVNKSINNRVNQGALLVNYVGHGGRLGLAHERVVTFDDIATWNNYYNMPVFLTATCEFSAFDIPSPEDLSAGVRIFLREKGGAVALFTTTRLAWSGSNLSLNSRFFNNAFQPMDDGEMPRLGDLIRLSKTTNERIKNFVLLGDPSMRMAYPQYSVNIDTELMPDTISAFQQVEVSGYITDHNGDLASNFNGVVFPKVYDKRKEYSTLGNDPDSDITKFTMQNSLIYRGKASVTNGLFSFSFIVPQDIQYSYGPGKLSFYADNGTIDATGFSESFIIGGTADDYNPDNTGPEIRLFMNDTTFVSGDMTNENPILLGFLYDESGINLTGNIGHDLVAYLNNDRANSYVLNNYYEADLDTYKSGKVAYPFHNVPEGRHTVTLRAWDVFNNFSEETIAFVVSSSAKLAIYDVLNHPNPFNFETDFTFKHNVSSQDLEVTIDIYNLNGQLLKRINTEVFSPGFQSPGINWDGKDNYGKPIGTGVYVYRLTVKTIDGQRDSGSSKLVIIK